MREQSGTAQPARRLAGLWGALARRTTRAPAPATVLRLETWPRAIYAMGDVHGHFELYQRLEAQIAADAATFGGEALLIVLGDVIDRGPQSAQMLDHLCRPAPPALRRVVLRGNHEAMFTRFIDDPAQATGWLRHGGSATLASYGLDPAAFAGGRLSAREKRQRLGAAIAHEHLALLRALPDALICAPYLFCHAGVDPTRPPEAQLAHDLHWGAAPSPVTAAPFALCVVHGHTPTAQIDVTAADGHINVDSGAYATGRLSAVRLLADAPARIFDAQLSNLSAPLSPHTAA